MCHLVMGWAAPQGRPGPDWAGLGGWVVVLGVGCGVVERVGGRGGVGCSFMWVVIIKLCVLNLVLSNKT